MEDTLEESIAENISNNNVKYDNFGVEVIIKEFCSFREFQFKIESKLDKLEDNIFRGKSKNNIQNANDNLGFVICLLKSRITSLESELSQKNGIMEFLSKQLV